ncbi:MAG: three-Cys-motif partner protein TcmP [Pseudomonadota bacterium]
MRRKSHVEKTVGPWAKQKLDALESYLEAYMQVMVKQPFKLFYIDAFAGAGIVKVRDKSNLASIDSEYALLPEAFQEQEIIEAEEFILGSPLRALGLSRPFHHYRFVDMDPVRTKGLDELIADYQVGDARALTGEANSVVQDIAKKFTHRLWRGVAFLDPYGPHLHWETVAALAGTGKFDVIINFPLAMAINRLVKRDGIIPERWQIQLDQCFGCRDWRDLAFGKDEGLFGDIQYKRTDAAAQLLGLYVRRLEEIFEVVAQPSLVKNTQGRPLYYLIWASSNRRGLPIANHILGLGEKVKVPRRG